jgi:predicted phosphoadenosine phosphosulfate sulfurtransferase
MIADYNSYNNIVIAFSGGKDSLACLLHILEQGADKNKIELWHHLIDGRSRLGRKVNGVFEILIAKTLSKEEFEHEVQTLAKCFDADVISNNIK